MNLWHRRALSLAVVLTLATAVPSFAAGVDARFDLSSPSGVPFPTDLFTVADPSHNTGRRVSLAKPDCAARPSDCADIDVLNTLDGFNLQPRVSIPFSGAIDVATVNSGNVFFLSLGDALGGGGGQVIGINQAPRATRSEAARSARPSTSDRRTTPPSRRTASRCSMPSRPPASTPRAWWWPVSSPPRAPPPCSRRSVTASRP